jgi:hypothetical protein
LPQTIHVAGESDNSLQNLNEGNVFILVPRKCRVKEKECNPVPGNIYGVICVKNGAVNETYVRKEIGTQRTRQNKTQ